MKYVYPAVFRSMPQGYTVVLPDIDGTTQGDNLQDSMEMAEDLLCLKLYDIEETGKTPPNSTNIKDIAANTDDIVTLIHVDTDDYRKYYKESNRLIKKTLSIPQWINERAEEAKINFSQTLTEALKDKLQIAE